MAQRQISRCGRRWLAVRFLLAQLELAEYTPLEFERSSPSMDKENGANVTPIHGNNNCLTFLCLHHF
eukprot:m.143356 g.143356  ORF g.143356 m.143356 type:complete len:67 (+) comp30313_c0_seq1:3853-4053(+)